MAIRHFSTGLVNTLAKAGGKSFADIMANGVIGFYDGSMPANADATEGSANLLLLVTLASGAFTGGVATNGINMDAAILNILYKKVGEVWSGLGLAAAASPGVQTTWARWYANAYTTGASTTAARVDLDVSTAGASINIGSTLIVQGYPLTIDNMNIPFLQS